MKKWMYLIAPGLMLAGFFVLYFSHAEELHKKELAQKAKIEQERVEADTKKKVAETKAREDAKKRQEERDAEEKKKLDEKMARQAADDKRSAIRLRNTPPRRTPRPSRWPRSKSSSTASAKRRTRPVGKRSIWPSRWSSPVSLAVTPSSKSSA